MEFQLRSWFVFEKILMRFNIFSIEPRGSVWQQKWREPEPCRDGKAIRTRKIVVPWKKEGGAGVGAV